MGRGKNELFPIIIGGGLQKEGVAVKSKKLPGYDIYIFDSNQNNPHCRAWINFPTIEGIENLIRLLEETKKLWQREEQAQ